MKAIWFNTAAFFISLYGIAYVFNNIEWREEHKSAETAALKLVDTIRCITTIDDIIIGQMIDDSVKAGKKCFIVSSRLSSWPQTVRVTVIAKNRYIYESLTEDGCVKYKVSVTAYPNYLNTHFGKKKRK